MSLDSAKIRQEFPILGQNGNIYLDSAATAQKPSVVLQAMQTYYEEHNANVHRGMHALAESATIAYENARQTVAQFVGCKPHEIVYTKNGTEALNLVAMSWAKANVTKDDVIVLSILEHHSNIVPWQQLQHETGCRIEWVDIHDDGSLNMEELDGYLAKGNVKMVSVTGQSNVLGVCPPLKEIIQKAHDADALCCVDAAQLVAHQSIDVTELHCDFLSFSGHKLYGPTGIGVLYAKREHLESMPPFLGGGMMIQNVTVEGFTPAEIPAKFEAGTPPIAEAIGLAAAINWLSQFDWKDIKAHDAELYAYTSKQLQTINNVTLLPHPSPNPILSFIVDGIHPHDLTEIIGRNGVSMRAGHHCAQPLHARLGINASTRLSFGIYNTKEDIDRATEEIQKAISILNP